MKKHHMPEMKESGVNVTPLIDIIMCLIVFFMLVTKVGVSRAVNKEVKLPSLLEGTKIQDMGDTFTLNVQSQAIGSEPLLTAQIAEGGKPEEIKPADLVRILKLFKEKHKDKHTVIIRGDENLKYNQLQVVLLAAVNAGITDTAYEAKKGENAHKPPA